MRSASLLLPVMLLAVACDANPSGTGDPVETPASPRMDAGTDPMAARDPLQGETAKVDIADPEARPVMQLQVVLDRLGFTPGVVDGKQGLSTRNAILGFQEASGLEQTGTLDEATRGALARWSNIQATRVVTIPPEFAAGPFYAIPESMADQAKMPALGYVSFDEKLAERFHTTVEVLHALNPGGVPAGMAGSAAAPASVAPPTPASSPTGAAFSPQPGPPSVFRAGQQVRVPNVGADAIRPDAIDNPEWLRTLVSLGVGTSQPEAERIVVSKSKGTLKAYDGAGKLVGMYTATMGSKHDPLPLGNWVVKGVARNPPFHYNPDLFWDAAEGDSKEKLPPGPNGPVGVVWIDLDKPHYGIHGTPEPQTIGRAESHGCVRLTNWDAARLAQMVSPGTKVVFEA